MTKQVYAYIKDAVARYSPRGPVLEVGSLNINGTIRDLFPQEGYVGIDMREGPGVDFVMNTHDSRLVRESLLVRESFQSVVCCEMLEHDDAFWETLSEMYRVLVRGGLLFITTRNIGYGRHDYPSDYWRFTADGLRAVMTWAGFEVLEAIDDEEQHGTYAVGRKN